MNTINGFQQPSFCHRSILPELSVQILELAREHGRVTVADAAKITDASRNTIKEHIRSLSEKGHLVRHGAGRGTWYSLVEPNLYYRQLKFTPLKLT